MIHNNAAKFIEPNHDDVCSYLILIRMMMHLNPQTSQPETVNLGPVDVDSLEREPPDPRPQTLNHEALSLKC